MVDHHPKCRASPTKYSSRPDSCQEQLRQRLKDTTISMSIMAEIFSNGSMPQVRQAFLTIRLLHKRVWTWNHIQDPMRRLAMMERNIIRTQRRRKRRMTFLPYSSEN